MMSCMVEEKKIVTREIIDSVVQELRWQWFEDRDQEKPLQRAAAEEPQQPTEGAINLTVFRAGQFVEIPLYRREQMAPGAVIAGPAVIAEDETSTFISNSFDAHIDGAGSIVMERKAA